ncbi:MAG: DUF1722 domain-containing protein [Candidatus Eisenbacteria bacterium]|nr:DUF1722 domain-containing protein [Candidatus Eisenbacteria bacterium]
MRPRVGVSTCLLGENVRYNGGHARDRFLTDTFGSFVDWVPVCPEVETGLGTPREAMHLVGDPENPRLVTIKTNVDLTDRMKTWAKKRLKELEDENLDGFIFKSRSPSSGMERVKVFDEKGMPHKVGVGIWARAFMDRFPLIPVEDEGRLNDPVLRENFVERVFCLRRYREGMRPRRSRGALVDFHARHKLQIMAHSPSDLKKMGKLVAHAKGRSIKDVCAEYEELLMKALSTKTTTGKNANVLQHALGYFKDELSSDEKREMLDVVDTYRRNLVPLIVPVTLIAHYVRKYEKPYLATQTYLSPHPSELKLRNHA